MGNETYHFKLGSFECIAVKDGDTTYQAATYVANATREKVAQVLRRHDVDPEHIPSPYAGLVVDTGRHRVLIDTGAGDFAPGLGRLPGNLHRKGIAPDEIDTVIITHAHPDHLGGNTDDQGQVRYPNARYVLQQAEWDYWASGAAVQSPLNAKFIDLARRNLDPIGDRLHLIDGETEIVPGIHAVPAPGHTPGHMAVLIVSGNEQLIYISDTALHPIHLEHPDWYAAYDLDPAAALASKRRIFDRAAADQALVLAFHFDPFPSLGHVVTAGAGWEWQPFDAPGVEPRSTYATRYAVSRQHR